jgi:hypothetical protein
LAAGRRGHPDDGRSQPFARAGLASHSGRGHRDRVAEHLQHAGALRAGVWAAQIMDFVVSAPQLLESGNSLLAALARWLTETGGGGPGAFGAVRVGGEGILVLTTATGSRVLTAAEIDALRATGLLSGKAYAVYSVSQGGGSGAHPGGGPTASEGRTERLATDDPAIRGINVADPEKVAALQKALAEKGIKTGKNPMVILETNLYGNQTIKLVVDGVHRLTAARNVGMPFVDVVRITEAEFRFLCERAGLNPLALIQHSVKL